MYTLLTLMGLLPLSTIAMPVGEAFCKANVVVIKALLADVGGINYCSEVLNLAATTLTTTVYVTPSAVSTGLVSTITGPTVSVDLSTLTSATNTPSLATSSSAIAPVTSSAPVSFVTSTATKVETISVDVTVTNPVVQVG
ncbi:hypothetical protein PG997_002829 [Apiospora hydei]|uniref:Uncharacterized protein n=1 Tax=Apiospora hydei TaxID=1337664 RepID=A0ABR1WXK1_9PEZI